MTLVVVVEVERDNPSSKFSSKSITLFLSRNENIITAILYNNNLCTCMWRDVFSNLFRELTLVVVSYLTEPHIVWRSDCYRHVMMYNLVCIALWNVKDARFVILIFLTFRKQHFSMQITWKMYKPNMIIELQPNRMKN